MPSYLNHTQVCSHRRGLWEPVQGRGSARSTGHTAHGHRCSCTAHGHRCPCTSMQQQCSHECEMCTQSPCHRNVNMSHLQAPVEAHSLSRCLPHTAQLAPNCAGLSLPVFPVFPWGLSTCFPDRMEPWLLEGHGCVILGGPLAQRGRDLGAGTVGKHRWKDCVLGASPDCGGCEKEGLSVRVNFGRAGLGEHECLMCRVP